MSKHCKSLSPTAAAMENSSTEKRSSRKNSISAFFKNSWLAVKCRRQGNKVVPLQSTSDSEDPQPDTSSLKPVDLQDHTGPQPDTSSLKPVDLQDHTGPQPDTSSVSPTNCEANPADPVSVEEKQAKVKKNNAFCSFFKRTWRTVKRATKQHNKVAPLPPQDDTDSADPQPGPSDPEQAALQDPTDLQLDPSFPGPSTLPFSELYEAGEEVGRGFFGRVCQGIRKSDGQQVAIKFTTKRETDRYITVPGVSEPLFAEVALNLLLSRAPLSPYIEHMLDWFEEEDRFILVLEYSQPSKDLFKFVFRETPSESQARGLMYQAVLGAKHCLDRGVFHRDIKLDNYVINTATKQVKLIDFGCGEIVKRSGYKGLFIGYACPPEYFADFEYEAEPTTVWSLGIMMYRTVCGHEPLTAEHGGLSFDSRVSTEFQDLITRCLAHDPAERATMEQILQHDWFRQEQMSAVAQESDSSVT